MFNNVIQYFIRLYFRVHHFYFFFFFSISRAGCLDV